MTARTRLLGAIVSICAVAASAGPVSAATTTQGSAQLKFTLAATSSLALVTQYSAAFGQGNATPTLLPSAAGVCAGTGSEANFTLSFGTIVPQTAAAVGCVYKNAVAVSINTNDSAGYSVNEYLDSSPGTGMGVCAMPNGGASFPVTLGALSTSTRAGNPAAGSFTGMNLTGCTGGSIVPVAAGGTDSGGTVPGNPGTAGLEYYTGSTAMLALASGAGATTGTQYLGEDIQVNAALGAPSSNAGFTGVFMTIQLVSN
ncbi:MAG TPA: hypothetical protein VFB22_15875 [Candidatus Baltobacteraceae bacterium]|nr:hypothetical protein [Candidatus Baltobacteraceae bacterium]